MTAPLGGNGYTNPLQPPGGMASPRTESPRVQARQKIEQDCLKLIQAVQDLKKQGGEQSLRIIAAQTGMSKDEVNRYLSPTVRELYDYDRLMHVRRRNRPLYNWLIVSGPPRVDEGKWAGIMANTSKYGLFQAVALKYGYVVKHLGQRGQIIDVEYHGIENVSPERAGKVWRQQEAVLGMDEFLPPAPGPTGG